MVLPLIAAALMAASSPATEPEQREFHERTEKYELDFQYPVMVGADQFNAAVSQVVNKRIENFKDQFTAQVTDTRESRKTTPPPTSPGYLTGRYTASVLRNGIVTVLLHWTEYVPPAAHPGDGMASVNYDTRTRRVLALSDLFRPDVNYASRLSELAIASLSRREYGVPEGAVSGMVRSGAGPVADNFKVFTLTDTRLVLHFPTYQVAPGAAGPQEVEIPLDTLAPLLRRSWLLCGAAGPHRALGRVSYALLQDEPAAIPAASARPGAPSGGACSQILRNSRPPRHRPAVEV